MLKQSSLGKIFSSKAGLCPLFYLEYVMKNNNINIKIQIQELALPLLEEMNLELVDIDYRAEGSGRVVRVYIDKTGGVTIDDCAEVSRELGTLLDVNEIISHSYNLEVSSPGLDRELKKNTDYEKYRGRKLKLKLNSPVKKQFVLRMAKLCDFSNEIASIEFEGDKFNIPLSNIDKANLELDF